MDSELETPLFWNASMGHARGVLDETLNTSEALGDCEDSEAGKKFLALVEASLQLEAQHSSVASHLTFDDVSLRMIWKSRVVYLLNLGLSSKKLADSFRILPVAFHSHSQGLDTPEN